MRITELERYRTKLLQNYFLYLSSLALDCFFTFTQVKIHVVAYTWVCFEQVTLFAHVDF